MKYTLFIGLSVLCLHVVFAQTNTSTTGNPTTKTPTTTKPTTKLTAATTSKVPPVTTAGSTVAPTTLAPAEQCSRANGSCDDCVKVGSGQCVWCSSNNKCLLKKSIIPTSECGLADAKWAVCWVNYEALIIAASMIGGLIIITIAVCCCCCCCSCCKDNKAKFIKEDAKYERKKSELKTKHAERRAERKEKTDEIRRKYGLIKDDTPYTRFDDN